MSKEITSITVKFKDGDEFTYANPRVGSFHRHINHDIPGKQEWDTYEISVSGPKRPITRD